MDIAQKALSGGRAEKDTIKESVEKALRVAASTRDAGVARTLDILADAEYAERSEAWR